MCITQLNYKGFTLIELLVVIAIIGILASVVMVQFPGAVGRAKDSRVFSSMSQLRIQTSILYANKGNYSDLDCQATTDKSVKVLCEDIQQNAGSEGLKIYINNNSKGFCAIAHLGGANKYFCIDGELTSKEYVAVPPACLEVCKIADSCGCE